MSAKPWPKCTECGGPARPRGEPALSTEYLCETKSELNLREHWAQVSKRKQRQGADTMEALAVALGEGQRIPKQGPWFVRFTRVSRGTLDNEDNLPAAFKRIKDTVAAAIGVDDKSPRVRWAYAQAKGKTLGVKLEIWNWRDDDEREGTGKRSKRGTTRHGDVQEGGQRRDGAGGQSVRWTYVLRRGGTGKGVRGGHRR